METWALRLNAGLPLSRWPVSSLFSVHGQYHLYQVRRDDTDDSPSAAYEINL